MERLNKKIKDLYNQEHSPLPNEMKWEEMKDGIFEKMKDQEKERSPIFTFPFGLKLIRGLLSVIVLLIIVAGIYFSKNNKEVKQPFSNTKNYTSTAETKQKPSTEQQKNSDTKIEQENSLQYNSNILTNKNLATAKSVTQNIKEDSDFAIEKNEISSYSSNTKEEVDATANAVSSFTKKKSLTGKEKSLDKSLLDLTIITTETDVFSKKLQQNSEEKLPSKQTLLKSNVSYEKNNASAQIEKKVISSNIKETDFRVIKPLIAKTWQLVSTVETLQNTIAQKIYKPAFNETVKHKEGYNSVKLEVGFTYLQSQYKKLDVKQYKTETGFFSNYLNLNYSRTFAKGIYFSTGLTFSRFKTKFELSDTIIHNYFVENTLTKSVKNAFTGKTVRDVYEDVEAPALSTRMARHYNKFDALSIPIIVGKRWSYKKLSYNIGIGSAVSIYSSAEGKTLRDNEMVSYSKAEPDPYNNGLQISALLETGIGLALNQKIDFIVNFRYNKHFSNWADNNFIVKPNAFMFGTGLKLKL